MIIYIEQVTLPPQHAVMTQSGGKLAGVCDRGLLRHFAKARPSIGPWGFLVNMYDRMEVKGRKVTAPRLLIRYFKLRDTSKFYLGSQTIRTFAVHLSGPSRFSPLPLSYF
jgi:hypothetical protein